MKQIAKHICKCGAVATVRHKPTNTWLCEDCALEKMVCDYGRERGLTDIWIAPGDKGTDFFALLVEVQPIKINWN